MVEYYSVYFTLLFLFFLSLFGSFVYLFIIALFRQETVFEADVIRPDVTLIVPACNEESVIRDKIENCLSLTYEKLSIIVVSDGSDDSTEEILSEYEDRITVIRKKEREGKAAALNTGVSASSGEILVFTDATVLLRQDCIEEMVVPLSDNRFGIVFGRVDYRKKTYSSLTKGEMTYWNYENLLRILQNRTGYIFSVVGGLCALPRKLYTTIPREVVSDDLYLAFSIYSQGFLGHYLPEILGWEENLKSTQAEFQRKIRVIAGGWQFFTVFRKGLGKCPAMGQFLVQKPLRWLSAHFLLFHAVFVLCTLNHKLSIATATIYSAMFFLPICELLLRFIYLSLSGKTDIKIRWLFLPFYFIMVNLAALLGFVKNLTRTQKSTWKLGR